MKDTRIITGYQALVECYDRMWNEALQQFSSGTVHVDQQLLDKQNDRRKGLTVIIRPDQYLLESFSPFLEKLQQICPRQHIYLPQEIHITVLSLFTATEHFAPYFAKTALYKEALHAVLSDFEPFTIMFKGITASGGVVMIQGFPEHDSLNRLRNKLRQALRIAGLGSGLDTRYIITTAHATILRFSHQSDNMEAVISLLKKFRQYEFGTLEVDKMYLVENDWYMSLDKVKVLQEFKGPSRPFKIKQTTERENQYCDKNIRGKP
jgi:2'-5' RNA ligase